MNRERMAELVENLKTNKHCNELKWVAELLAMRREKHLSNLEDSESGETRGRSKECKDLLKLLNE